MEISYFYDVKNAILVDKDPIVAGLWKYLISVREEEILSLPELPNVGDCVDNYDLPQEAKWLIGFWLNRGSATPKKSRTAYSARKDKAQLNWGARAKERIASQLNFIRYWSVLEGEYLDSPKLTASWFIDPPYGEKGKYYRIGFCDFKRLSEWRLDLKGQIITCEAEGATWLPFAGLGSFKTSKGASNEVVHIEERP